MSVNKRRGTWTPEEDIALIKAVQENGAKNWKKIAESVPGRTYVQCLHRWQKVLNPNLVKGPWTEEEDRKVIELVNIHGPRKWELIASHLPGRIGKQCRERWKNHLDPSIKKGNWEPQEDELILRFQSRLGNKWATIAKFLPGRTDNAVKNRFNSTLSRRLRQQKDGEEKKEQTRKKSDDFIENIEKEIVKSNISISKEIQYEQSLKMKEANKNTLPSIMKETNSNILPSINNILQPYQSNINYSGDNSQKSLTPNEKIVLSPTKIINSHSLYTNDFSPSPMKENDNNYSPQILSPIVNKRKAEPLSPPSKKQKINEKPLKRQLFEKENDPQIGNINNLNKLQNTPIMNGQKPITVIPNSPIGSRGPTMNGPLDSSIGNFILQKSAKVLFVPNSPDNIEMKEKGICDSMDSGVITLHVLNENNEKFKEMKEYAIKLLSGIRTNNN